MENVEDATDASGSLEGALVGIVGYGNQGRAQALNLRDGGRRVRVAVRSGGPGEAGARADGFDPEEEVALAAEADVLALLLPDDVLPDLAPGLLAASRPGTAIVLAHGSALAFGTLEIPPGLDALVVAPTGPGTELRAGFTEGRPIPALLAVHRDASGAARERALAHAIAIGCARDQLVWTSVEEEAVVDLFGEQVVLCGGLTELAGRAFDTLIGAGYAPEIAYLECVQQLRLTTALISEHGVEGMRDRISRTALYGALETGPRVIGEASERAMAEILERIRSGAFFRELVEDRRAGGGRLRSMRRRSLREGMEAAGRRARAARSRRNGTDPA